jgi:hypothetical protein
MDGLRFVLVLLGVESLTIPRQFCAANERSGQGEEQVYISRSAPSRAQEIIIIPSWAILRNSISHYLFVSLRMIQHKAIYGYSVGLYFIDCC